MCYLVTKRINGFYNCIVADNTQKIWSDSLQKAKRKVIYDCGFRKAPVYVTDIKQ